ncbi:exopolyphosphatase [Vibrio nigripulchritudo SFn27]|uniref:Exopolyphosphatase n=1 Tax=Vibrio nigripulchritudo TaxID=28173 RepID=U4K219_9VIBR|nr:exopolyphosphatase [Vibrio nigripulchritudo]CCN83246.1 exopolyphosphatase [Vibrio nigripulchritudo BLFn1]CCN88571.1 exopolyphosphatase [Vibrio nigripulchritudo SFn27]CCN92709.1 exopolyphosphatase [Vibrio nigripulchritudo ENn2]CCO40295.1 exopolyphosphatase [Vibrio nigripulchritudo SFn135]CCO52721.1 exopolyphosphatase [Vibrio nigripulchritudo Wn13]
MTEIESRDIAAIDLGSNSFHMVVAKVVGQDLQIVSRHKQRVRLASGLDSLNNLDNSAIQRGLDCLKIFAERLQGFEPENVRIAATHTLRQANNAHIFIQRAAEILPFPIEVISGLEEGRLIYTGVAHTQPESETKLVIDIGGGSTEMIIGTGFEPKMINSKRMGCVSFTDKYFANGKLNRKNFNKAEIAVEQRLESLTNKYIKHGWDVAIGSSGTTKSIREVLINMGFEDGIITLKRLQKLIDELLQFDQIDDVSLPGLTEERQPVFAAGVVILEGIFKALSIDKLHFSPGALREGLLYEMEERFERSDIRMRTTENLARKHLVDLEHADKVRKQARKFLEQLAPDLGIKKSSELFDLLEWSAMLHEVGLSISYQGFHRHSEYILKNTNMPGFNQEQQLVLASLARFQRKALKLHELPEFALFKTKHILPLIRIMRLAVLINGQRNETPLPDIQIQVNDDTWTLSCDEENWLEDNKLLEADLELERDIWKTADWTLKF